MKKNLILYPFLFTIAPLLGLYADNVSEAHFGDIVRSLLCSLGVMVLVVLVTIILVKGIAKAGLPALLFAFFVFGFSYLMRLLPPLIPIGYVLSLWTAFWVMTYVASVIWMRRTKRDLTHLTQILNLVGAAIVLAPLAMSAPTWFSKDVNSWLADGEKSTDSRPATATQPSSYKPDIYFIILDAYAREDVLKKHFNCDNSPFIEKLRKKGFYVADKSNSNYMRTHFSLAATLNLTYLDEHLKKLGDVDDTGAGYLHSVNYFSSMITDSRVQHYLEGKGYRILTGGSGYNVTKSLDKGEMDMNEFELTVLQQTVFAPIFRKWVTWRGWSPHDIRREQVKRIFRAIPAMAETPGPKFVFLHIVCPHRPFIFKPDGGDKPVNDTFARIEHSPKMVPGWEDWHREYYAEQVQGLNIYVEKAVDQILAASPKPPVIILQGDHGSALTLDRGPAKFDVQERFGILNAMYLPSGATPQLYPEISSINTFRVILNRYFGENYPLLPDRNFQSGHGGQDLTEVTDIVNLGGNRP